MTVKSYDQKSYDLARDFLDDESSWQRLSAHDKERTADELARDIQMAIEDYIEWLREQK